MFKLVMYFDIWSFAKDTSTCQIQVNKLIIVNEGDKANLCNKHGFANYLSSVAFYVFFHCCLY
jgi:hypothetical protein